MAIVIRMCLVLVGQASQTHVENMHIFTLEICPFIIPSISCFIYVLSVYEQYVMEMELTLTLDVATFMLVNVKVLRQKI